jgi:hypothetical protein
MSLSLAPTNLTQGEVQAIKFELGFNQLTVGAEPYVGITRYFEQIVLPNLYSGSFASCSTSVAASPITPAAVSLVLSPGVAGFSVMDHVFIDVDTAQEWVTIQGVNSGSSSITVQLSKAHGAGGFAYPVEVESGQGLVRQYLTYLRKIRDRIHRFGARAGVKKADELEFFGGSHGRASEASGFVTLEQMQEYFRTQLCMLLFGVGNIQQLGGAGGNRIAMR